MNAGTELVDELASRRRKKSLFQKVNRWLHLWLGLASGIIVLIVCLTAAIWVFNEEITYLTEPTIRAETRQAPVVIPSRVLAVARQVYPGKAASYAYYQQGTAVRVGVGTEHDAERHLLFLDPYTGHVQGSKTYRQNEKGFFEWILLGHQYLWLPKEIGQPVVNYGTLVFTVLLITGLIWWYPAKWTRASRQKSFRIKWRAGWKRINLDLHNVLGFYTFLVLLALALSGMVYGLPWYSKGLYWVSSGGETEPEWKRVSSDPAQEHKRYTYNQALDRVWARMITENPSAGGFFYAFPDSTQAKSTISIRTYPAPGQFYDVARHTFDRHTLQRLNFFEVFDKSFDDLSAGGKLRRMNYDIHIGTILGMPGKLLAFLGSLIGASLPVTGFLIWWNRKRFGRK
ncbi:PepSY-associated TM helix domain-containing protein [Larkinella insperata]|uniref:PepSY-associated TM helix domain-containing protein n=1 Tax=Larkinella insperata TaxID=332158 RepID=A0ABW3QGY7_9BACT